MIHKVKLTIIGMHCTSCAMNIDGELEECSEGIKNVKTNYAKQECAIEFEENKITLGEIIEIIKHAGYAASIVE